MFHIKTRPVNYPARKRRIIVMLLAYSAIAGVIFIFLPEEDSPLDYVVGFPLLVLGIAWCFADADERQHRIGKLMRLVLVLAFFIGFPLYLFQTRGFGGFRTLVLATLLVVAMFACLFLAGFTVLFVGDALGFIELVE